MSSFFEWLQDLFKRLRFWVMISPFEQGVRVRLGKHISLVQPGLRLCIPFIDIIYVQNNRLRLMTLGRHTVTTADGRTITFTASLGYAIGDIMKLYMTLHHAEDTVRNVASSCITNYLVTHYSEECAPSVVMEEAKKQLNLEQYGLSQASLYLTEYMCLKTYRLVGDKDFYDGGNLSTTSPTFS